MSQTKMMTELEYWRHVTLNVDVTEGATEITFAQMYLNYWKEWHRENVPVGDIDDAALNYDLNTSSSNDQKAFKAGAEWAKWQNMQNVPVDVEAAIEKEYPIGYVNGELDAINYKCRQAARFGYSLNFKSK